MEISTDGIQRLISMEGGAQLTMSNDLEKSKGHCPIGVGHLVHKGTSISQAKKLLKTDLAIAESTINSSITVTLTQNKFYALVSFVFNAGITSSKYSTLKNTLILSNTRKHPTNSFYGIKCQYLASKN